jgi:biopolymer transport protein ExbB
MLVIWRILLNINGNTDLNSFLPSLQQKLDKEGVDAAIAYCRKRDDIIPKKLFAPGLEAYKASGLSAARRAMANAIDLEIVLDLNFLLPSILAIAKIATMVGLFGTVVSMIGTFSKIGQAGAGGAGQHSESIGLALFATALGLVTAIPLVFAHVLMKNWAHTFELRMKSAAQKLLVLLQGRKTTAPAAAAAASAAPIPLANPTGAIRR